MKEVSAAGVVKSRAPDASGIRMWTLTVRCGSQLRQSRKQRLA